MRWGSAQFFMWEAPGTGDNPRFLLLVIAAQGPAAKAGGRAPSIDGGSGVGRTQRAGPGGVWLLEGHCAGVKVTSETLPPWRFTVSVPTVRALPSPPGMTPGPTLRSGS